MCGVMMDLDDPDLEIVAIRVAARHSGLLGLGSGVTVWQVICHLNKVTEDAAMLYRPISVSHIWQNMCKNFLVSSSSNAKEERSNPASIVEEEYYSA